MQLDWGKGKTDSSKRGPKESDAQKKIHRFGEMESFPKLKKQQAEHYR